MKQYSNSYFRYKHFTAFFIVIPIIILISFYISNSIEKNIEDRIKHILGETDSSWSKIRVDGLEITVTGEAPNETLRSKTIEILKGIVAPWQLIERTTVQISPSNQKPNFKLLIIKDTNGISVIGMVPNNMYKGTIIKGFRSYSDKDIRIETNNNEKIVLTENWTNNLKLALLSLSHFSDGTISITPKSVIISISALDNNNAKKIKEAISANAIDISNLSVNVIVPKTLISPYTFEYIINRRQGIINTCSVENLYDQNSITEKAKKYPLKENPVCVIGIGSPSPNWSKAVEEAILLMQSIGEGTVKISDLQVSLLVKGNNSEILTLTDKFKKNLPQEFSVNLKFQKLNMENKLKDKGILGIKVEKDGSNKIKISGQLKTKLEKQVIESYAKVLFSNQTIELNIDLNEILPANLVGNTTIGMEALKSLHSGLLIVEQDRLQLNGKIASIEGPAKTENFLKKMLNSKNIIKTDITYDKSLSPTIVPISPNDCVKDINEVLKTEKIVFEPASTAIKGSSRLAIKKIATIIEKCEHVKMEIGGHTDSQGREEMNLNLSQLRADAVKSSLLLRRVLVKNLISQGYGEKFPIADNKTEEGRETNRRIEFKLINNTQLEEVPNERKKIINND